MISSQPKIEIPPLLISLTYPGSTATDIVVDRTLIIANVNVLVFSGWSLCFKRTPSRDEGLQCCGNERFRRPGPNYHDLFKQQHYQLS